MYIVLLSIKPKNTSNPALMGLKLKRTMWDVNCFVSLFLHTRVDQKMHFELMFRSVRNVVQKLIVYVQNLGIIFHSPNGGNTAEIFNLN